jgi:ubiquinone/menaquinone biosynthesis C-methylase UbiE
LNALLALLVIGLLVGVLRQCRKPAGPLGRILLRTMNASHSPLTEWGLSQVGFSPDDVILDVGCGGGRTVQRLATLAPAGSIYGLDYSAASVRASRAENAGATRSGRVQIRLGSVEALPFPDQTFDVVTAVETHYYWPDLPANLREVFRVLKPAGTVAIIAEAVRDEGSNAVMGAIMRLLQARYMTPAEHRDLLTQAGFMEVSTFRLPGKSWICVTGRKPGSRIH